MFSGDGCYRKVRHKNVVQFIGACTRSPNLCIVTGKCVFCVCMPGLKFAGFCSLLRCNSHNTYLASFDFHGGLILIYSVSEFMARGSIYDFLHKQKGVFKLQSLLKVALDVSKGMNYLHQNNIIHRDLKTANLLMDEHDVSFNLCPLIM